MSAKQGPLDVTFEVQLEKSDAKGGWTYVVTTPRTSWHGALRAEANNSAGTREGFGRSRRSSSGLWGW